MTKLKTLLWVSILFPLISCKHIEDEQPEKELSVVYTQPICYEQDTVIILASLGGELNTNDIIWDNSNVSKFNSNYYAFIAPAIYTDTLRLKLTAQAGKQKNTSTITILKQASKYATVSYQTDIQPLLNGNCNFSGCHANGSRAGKVELSVYDSVVKWVAPYNANASLLYTALIKTDPLRIMPPAGKLHDYKIEEVRLWVEQGAKRN